MGYFERAHMTEENQEHISFERLDELIGVTNPKGWMILVGLFFLIFSGFFWLLYGKIYQRTVGTGILLNIEGIQSITATLSGRIIKFDAKLGDLITEGQPVVYVDPPVNASGQASVITSLHAGKVFELDKAVGDYIFPGTTLMRIESSHLPKNTLQGIIYISAAESENVKPGMKISIVPLSIKPEEYGSLIGTITYVSSYISTKNSMMRILNNEELVNQLLNKGPQLELYVSLTPDSSTVSQYKWTSDNGAPIKIRSGMLCEAKITSIAKRPISFIMPKTKELLGIE